MKRPKTSMEIRCFRPKDEPAVVALWQRWLEIAHKLTREVADAALNEFEERGHKQAYWLNQHGSTDFRTVSDPV